VNFVVSKNGIQIRLTEERWAHIIEGHPELKLKQTEVLNTIEHPERILTGNASELLAIREIEVGKWLVVVYKEVNEDGFIITAFLTRKIRSLNRRKQVWP